MYSSIPTSEPNEWICRTQPDSIAGMSAGCGFKAKWVAILPFRPSLSAERRQQELDRGRAEADPVIDPLHAIGPVDALDREHRGQDLPLGDRRGIARE
ncbi:hypothetical protein ACVWZR_010231 [Bradyrhizobium sp. i1.3.1]